MEESQEKKIKGEDSGSALMFLNTFQHGYMVGDFSSFTFDFSIFTEELLDQSKAWEAEPLHLWKMEPSEEQKAQAEQEQHSPGQSRGWCWRRG